MYDDDIMANIEPADIIRVIQQYLKENNLLRTLQAIQDETSVSLNTVDSIETFVNDINSGHWDVVLKVVKLLKLPDNKLMDLYEQIALELIELRETRAANWVIHKTEPMMKLKSAYPERYLHLQNMSGRSYFDAREAYRDGGSKERRRATIANDLKKEVSVVPSQRLLTLIGDALKWQKHEGLLPSSTSINIFTGKAYMDQVQEERPPSVLHKHCIRPIKSLGIDDEDDDDPSIFVCCADFSPDGHYIVVGYSTGLLEIRNPTTGRLSNDLKYQAQKNFIVTPSKKAALSLCFSASEMMAVGDKSGDISVWKLETGQLVQLFQAAHVGAVSCLIFHRSGREVLSGGLDKSVRLHGMKSRKTIRDYKGHTSFVKALAYTRDDNYIISGGSDSTIRIWNSKTGQQSHKIDNKIRIHTIALMPNSKDDRFLVGDRKCLQVIDLKGTVRARFSADLELQQKDKDADDDDESSRSMNFNAACSSPKGTWLYSIDSKHIYCFNYSTKKVQNKMETHEERDNDLIGIKHHPFLNILATFDTQGNLKLWKP